MKCSARTCMDTSKVELVDPETGKCTDCTAAAICDAIDEYSTNPFLDHDERRLFEMAHAIIMAATDDLIASALEFKKPV